MVKQQLEQFLQSSGTINARLLPSTIVPLALLGHLAALRKSTARSTAP